MRVTTTELVAERIRGRPEWAAFLFALPAGKLQCMAYYIRLITKSRDYVSVQRLAEILAESGTPGLYGIIGGTEARWSSLAIRNTQDEDVCHVERNERGRDELFDEEASEFLDSLEVCLPRSGANWVADFLRDACVIYAARFLSFDQNNSSIEPYHVLWALKRDLGGIIQADREGFTNEEGYNVVWQLSEDQTGDWTVAVLNADGTWKRARIDLSNDEHRVAFKNGRIPNGVEEI